MSLITPTEVSTIAFVNALDPALILPAFITSAESKYIVSLVTQAVITKITETPSEYTTLVNNYIKPYEAFCIKYMFYNQLLTETDTFPTSDEQRKAALQEVLSIMEVNRDLLAYYLNANIFDSPITTTTKKIAGFRTGTDYSRSVLPAPTYDLIDSLNGASYDVPASADSFNFVQFASGLLKKITWASVLATLKTYFDTIYPDASSIALLKTQEIPFEFNNITIGTAQTYVLDIKCLHPYQVLAAILETDTGFLSGVSVSISSTPITGLSGVTVSTTTTETQATGSNLVAEGNRLTISTSASYTGNPTTLRGKLKILYN